jgi:hypothetical protein
MDSTLMLFFYKLTSMQPIRYAPEMNAHWVEHKDFDEELSTKQIISLAKVIFWAIATTSYTLLGVNVIRSKWNTGDLGPPLTFLVGIFSFASIVFCSIFDYCIITSSRIDQRRLMDNSDHFLDNISNCDKKRSDVIKRISGNKTCMAEFASLMVASSFCLGCIFVCFSTFFKDYGQKNLIWFEIACMVVQVAIPILARVELCDFKDDELGRDTYC